ncbi:tetratricopeptide repeat protein [Flavobacteriaceae bacterium]|nr:tetratricopeptide repeat protein [Flavobacteriaceae bacterium]
MTNNHLLIYRLAELMLKKQQHILALDDLFEDEQIGTFVRSIQIDSPYQQLIFEGVLTETIKEKRVMVTFTVEGYFHYVLGEVIEKQTEGKGVEALKDLLENNQLRGIKEGVEQCLVKDVEKDDLARLMWLIDEGGKALETSAYPLAQAFLIHTTERVMDELLADPSDNDIEVLEKAIETLESAQRHDKVQTLYQLINNSIDPNNFKNLSIIIDSIEYMDHEKGIKSLIKLGNLIGKYKNKKQQQVLLQEIGIQFLNKDDYTNAEIYLKKSIELEKEIKNKNSKKKLTLGRTYSYLSSLWIEKMLYEKALKHYKEELNILLKDKEKEEKNLALVYNNLGYLYSCLYDSSSKNIYLNKAKKNYELSLTIRKKIFGKNHPSLAIAFNNLGLLYSNLDLIKSEKFHKKSLEIRLKIFEDKSPTDISYNNISLLYSKKGDLHSAINFGEKALLIRIKEFGFNSSKTSTSFNNLSRYYYELENYKKSLNYVKNAIKIRKKLFGPLSLKLASSYILLSLIYTEIKQYKDAINYESKALKIRLKKLGSDSLKTGLCYYNLGYLYHQRGDIKKAIRNYKKALKIEVCNLGIENSETGDTFFAVANLFLDNKEYKKALNYFLKGFLSNPDSGGFPFKIATCYKKLSKPKKAIENYCLSAEIRNKSLGIEDEATKNAINEAIQLAKETNSIMLLPDWIKKIANDQ